MTLNQIVIPLVFRNHEDAVFRIVRAAINDGRCVPHHGFVIVRGWRIVEPELRIPFLF
jgi:hypothetical protein